MTVASTDEEPAYRIQPHSEEAEQALLGALLAKNGTYEKVSEFLRPEHFFVPVHGRIYGAIINFVERGQVANPVTLKAYFERDTDLAALGGGSYLTTLAASVVTLINAEDYGHTIHNTYLRRQLIAVGESMVNEAHRHDLEISAQDQIEEAEKQLFDLASTGDVTGGFVPITRSLEAAISTAEAAFRRSKSVTGVTNWPHRPRPQTRRPAPLRSPHHRRPSLHGQDGTGHQYRRHRRQGGMTSNGTDGATVGVFSLEMSAEQLATRVLADETKVPSDKIRRGEVRDSDFPRFIEASQMMSRLPLHIDDTPGITVGMLRTRARRLKRTSNLGLIVVDYLQLMRGSGINRQENRVQEISEITRGLKAVAKELDIPVIALSQLSRAVEAREDKRPQLADLRESGSIEQDADVVMFVYREQYYLERAEPARRAEESEEKFNDRYQSWQLRLGEVHNIGDCIIAKQRHGPIGTVRLHFEGMFTRFSDLDPNHAAHAHSEE